MQTSAIKYFYCWYKDTENNDCHQFTTNKDSLSPDALFVKAFYTNHPGQLWRMVERYARHTGESCSIENGCAFKEWYRGELWYSTF